MRFTPQAKLIVEKLKNPFVILTLLSVFLVSLPLLRPRMFKIHDFTHGARIAEMTRALEDGHFPVRWSQNFGFGYGMPLFQFYGPLPFYVGSVIYWLTGHLIISVKSLFLISNIFTAWGAYLLGKKLFKSQLAASFVSIAVTLAPYRILNLYVRGALNELWGIMAIPWIILGIIKTIRSEKSGWLVLCLGLITLFLSHNITTMIFAPFAVLTVVVLLTDHAYKNKLNIRELAAALFKLAWLVLLAVGFSAFYLLPAFLEKDFTQVEQHILADYFNFRMHFLYIRQFFRANWDFGGSQWGPDDPISFFLGFGQLAGAFLSAVILLINLVKQGKNNAITFLHKKIVLVGFFVITALAAIFTTHRSIWFWEAISVMEFVQFPWRFLSLVIVYLAIVSGWSIYYLSGSSFDTSVDKKKDSLLLYKRMLVAVLFVLVLLNGIFVKPEEYLDDPSGVYTQEPESIKKNMSGILPDYIPSDLKTIDPVEALVKVEGESLETDKIEILVDRTHQKLVRTNFSEKTSLDFQLADYPGWQTYQNLIRVDHSRSDAGTISVNVSPGEQLIALKLRFTNVRLISDLLSLASFILILVLLLSEEVSVKTSSLK